MRFWFERSVRVERVLYLWPNLSKVTVSFLFVPRKKAWERRCAWPQAPKRWPWRLFAIKLRINDGFGMFFRCILTTRFHFIHLLSRFLFGAPMGATRHEHQIFHSRMHGKDGATGQFTSFAQNIFFDANCHLLQRRRWALMVIQERNAGLYLPSAFNHFPTCFLEVYRATLCPHGHSNDGPWV